MSHSLEILSKRLKQDLGLVANVVSINNVVKIVGGTAYDDRNGISLYVKKYEILLSDNVYHLKLPVGQTFIEADCESDDKVIATLLSHFKKYYPTIKLDKTVEYS